MSVELSPAGSDHACVFLLIMILAALLMGAHTLTFFTANVVLF